LYLLSIPRLKYATLHQVLQQQWRVGNINTIISAKHYHSICEYITITANSYSFIWLNFEVQVHIYN
jgi:hypothetical protein